MRVLPLAMALCVGMALGGCASVDESLFGSAAPAAEPSTAPAPETSADDQNAPAVAQGNSTPAATAEASAGTDQAIPGTLPSTVGPGVASAAEPPPETAPAPPQTASATPAPASPVPPAAAGTSPAVGTVMIVPGADTGTAPNHALAGVRATLQDAVSRVSGAGQQYATIRRSMGQQLATYYQAQGQITAQLQVGTTRANPELVSQWNLAQGALDQLTANINALGALSTQIGGEASRIRSVLPQIEQTRQMPGAVEDDGRQLAVLEDEANQVIVVLDRLSRDTSADLRRETAILSTERAHLAELANSIKAGGTAMSSGQGVTGLSSRSSPGVVVAGAPITTIRFAQAKVNYQKALYQALSNALQSQPAASFRIIGVSPARGSAPAVEMAQTEARRHAQDVMQTMSQMGVPVSRMDISSATDPTVRSTEVRVVVR